MAEHGMCVVCGIVSDEKHCADHARQQVLVKLGREIERTARARVELRRAEEALRIALVSLGEPGNTDEKDAAREATALLNGGNAR